jgi:16S rRNA (adenine1518-N6/adenine1519-N6)-dimethyltransferase
MTDKGETKKSLGQHWLNDSAILQSIVDSANITAGDNVLEIGPGHGTLTEKLASTGADITALEFDQDLIGLLKVKFSNTSQVKILEGDIRTFNFSSLPAGYKIVANIPYYLTSHLIRSISETSNPPSLAVLLIQKEVAERLCAIPGQMSILGLTAQYYFDCKPSILVPAKFFTPPPKVDSQVVQLFRKKELKFPKHDEQEFFRLIKAGFSEKRKTLRNSLSGGLGISKDSAVEMLKNAGLDPGSRAQALSMDNWYKLYVESKEHEEK